MCARLLNGHLLSAGRCLGVPGYDGEAHLLVRRDSRRACDVVVICAVKMSKPAAWEGGGQGPVAVSPLQGEPRKGAASGAHTGSQVEAAWQVDLGNCQASVQRGRGADRRACGQALDSLELGWWRQFRMALLWQA